MTFQLTPVMQMVATDGSRAEYRAVLENGIGAINEILSRLDKN